MLSPSFRLDAAPEGVRPRQWQRRLIQLLRRRLERPDDRDVLVNAGPGAGKTLGTLLAFRVLQAEGRLDALCICTHRTAIAEQWQAAAARLGLALGDGVPAGHGLVCSYQTLARDPGPPRLRLQAHAPMERWLLVADEVHHLGLDPEDSEGGWGFGFEALSEGAGLRVGLTGTPFRADRLGFCAARAHLERDGGGCHRVIAPDLCVEPQELIASGDVRPLVFHFQDGWVDHRRGDGGGEPEASSPLSEERRESWRARNLRRAVALGDPGGIAHRVLAGARRELARLRQVDAAAAGLVVARDIDHALTIGRLLEAGGDPVQVVHSLDPEATQTLQRFRQGEGRWLVSIDMCAEGFDAPRLRVVAYLTTVVTRSRFLQAITRAVRLDGELAAREPVPRHPSSIHAPADPLLMAHASGWSLSAPYRLRPLPDGADPATESGAGASSGSLPLRAVADRAGGVIALTGPELPPFLSRRGGSVTSGQAAS